MKPDTTLQLGDFVFSHLEIPEKIAFGGEQSLVVQELVGGVRVVDAMGRQDGPLDWSGMFLGETALDRARYLDGLRVAGKPLELYWSEFAYLVVIKSFRCDFERSYKLPYAISCVVVADLTLPIKAIAPGINEAISGDMDSAFSLGDLLGDGPLSDALKTVDSVIKTVSDFATAAQSTVQAVLAPIAAVQRRITVLIQSTGNTINSVTTLGGILPNNSVSQQAATMLGQVTAMTQSEQLYNLQSVMGRMSGNLGGGTATGGSIGALGKQAVVAGGNLYQMAAEAYGDAAEWTGIARASNLKDPMLTGVQTVNIPPQPEKSGGVFGG